MNSSASRPSRWARNPFVHNLELSLTDKMTMGLMSVTVFPVRLLLVSFLMLLGWPFAFVASLGRSEFVVEPQSWWRRLVDVALRVIMRAMWFCAGFHWVKVKGERAAPSQAAILTVAPHSTFFDAIPVTSTMCSIVAKLETQSIPVWGTLIQYIRPVLVLRSNLDSRRQTVEEIKRRARSGGEWPQIMIFPEGTCTNRSSLILFKAGAFLPGLPVQPVVLRYPNKLDTISWTWRGPGAWKILWLTLCQPHTCMEVEYLPVYTPSDQEKENPSLFANNVRKIMAKALEVPLTDLSFEDRELSFAEGPLKVYDPSSLLEFNHLLPRLRLKTTESSLQEQVSKVRKLRKHLLTLEDFALFLHVGVTDTLRHIHGLFNQQEEGQIDIRHYLLALSTIYRPSKSMDTLKMAFEMYDSQDTGQVHERDLAAMLEIMLGVKQVELSLVLMELGGPHNGKVTYDELWCFMAEHPHFVQDYLDFKDHPRHLSVGPHDSCNGHMTPDDTR
ncbi:lysophosphatidylcholine acyltransferase 1 isoform X1 [Entelurus aequoreus]|uniref:lysophosphatidylcholine acyltransferase 1 isoform X1 n=1 Tax=Entelurus aequoreus TaxID=161455 RepID=UPI002B1CE3A1|nr:lysophosphatidylcholine acyltransferase 1 isoform X1 [Entelurus aequoreus]XP_061886143.1 lysophosphatidylcholine acyltransferase 1 isoform X1 [Entelurus aequoreus]